MVLQMEGATLEGPGNASGSVQCNGDCREGHRTHKRTLDNKFCLPFLCLSVGV